MLLLGILFSILLPQQAEARRWQSKRNGNWDEYDPNPLNPFTRMAWEYSDDGGQNWTRPYANESYGPKQMPGSNTDTAYIKHEITINATSFVVGVIYVESGGALRFVDGQRRRIIIWNLLEIQEGGRFYATKRNAVPATIEHEIVLFGSLYTFGGETNPGELTFFNPADPNDNRAKLFIRSSAERPNYQQKLFCLSSKTNFGEVVIEKQNGTPSGRHILAAGQVSATRFNFIDGILKSESDVGFEVEFVTRNTAELVSFDPAQLGTIDEAILVGFSGVTSFNVRGLVENNVAAPPKPGNVIVPFRRQRPPRNGSTPNNLLVGIILTIKEATCIATRGARIEPIEYYCPESGSLGDLMFKIKEDRRDALCSAEPFNPIINISLPFDPDDFTRGDSLVDRISDKLFVYAFTLLHDDRPLNDTTNRITSFQAQPGTLTPDRRNVGTSIVAFDVTGTETYYAIIADSEYRYTGFPLPGTHVYPNKFHLYCELDERLARMSKEGVPGVKDFRAIDPTPDQAGKRYAYTFPEWNEKNSTSWGGRPCEGVNREGVAGIFSRFVWFGRIDGSIDDGMLITSPPVITGEIRANYTAKDFIDYSKTVFSNEYEIGRSGWVSFAPHNAINSAVGKDFTYYFCFTDFNPSDVFISGLTSQEDLSYPENLNDYPVDLGRIEPYSEFTGFDPGGYVFKYDTPYPSLLQREGISTSMLIQNNFLIAPDQSTNTTISPNAAGFRANYPESGFMDSFLFLKPLQQYYHRFDVEVELNYFNSKLDRDFYKHYFSNGRIYRSRDNVAPTYSQYSPSNIGRTEINYVAGADGNLYISPVSYVNPRLTNHSQFLGAAAVMSAGSILLTNGVIRSIDNSSGHYKPTPAHMEHFVNFLTRGGIDLVVSNSFGPIVTYIPRPLNLYY